MHTIAEVLASAAHVAADGRRRVTVPRVLQSWPGVVHGGAAVALFDAAAAELAPAGPRLVEARLTSSWPLETELELEARGEVGAVHLAMRHGRALLASGAVHAIAGGTAVEGWCGGPNGTALPTSDDCLACGRRNPLGLRATLRFDADGVWTRLVPDVAWRTPEGCLDPGLAPVLLDETAWWLGALVAREGGLTNRLSVRLVAPEVPFGTPVVAGGRFDRVTAIDRTGAFRRTETALMTEAGALVATASIVFRGGADYSARQLPYFRERTHPDVFRRMFPDHAP